MDNSGEVVPHLAIGTQTHQGLVPYLMTFSISRSAALGSLKRFMEMIVRAPTHLHTLSFYKKERKKLGNKVIIGSRKAALK